MGKYLKVEGHNDLIKDTKTHAVIKKEFKKHKNREMKLEVQQER